MSVLSAILVSGLATNAAFASPAPAVGKPQDAQQITPPVSTRPDAREKGEGAKDAVVGSTPASASGINGDLRGLSREEIRTLIRIVNMPPEKLSSLRQSLEHLEKMTPEERQQLRKKLEALRNSPTLPPPQANPLLHYWASLPPEKARTEKERFRSMTREERRAYVAEAIKKLPPPPSSQAQRPERRRFKPERENQ